MGFEANRQQVFSKRIVDLPDQPDMSARDLKAYFDSSAEELRQSFNELCNALSDFSAAAKMGYRASAGVPAKTVQDAIENVQQQLRNASVGQLPSGCVDGDKLAQDVRDRFTSIATSVNQEAAAREKADTALQQNQVAMASTLALKAEVTAAAYVGDGQTKRAFDLGFQPKAVILMREGHYTHYSNTIYGGIATQDKPIAYIDRNALAITENGFEVLQMAGCMLNQDTCSYTYVAFK